jgi:hypothetical protein
MQSSSLFGFSKPLRHLQVPWISNTNDNWVATTTDQQEVHPLPCPNAISFFAPFLFQSLLNHLGIITYFPLQVLIL